MDNQIHNAIVSFIWGIADDCLRDVYVRGKYRDVILPMMVICRLDAMLEDSKEAFKTRLISDVVTGKIDVRGIKIPEYEFVEETVVTENDKSMEGMEGETYEE